MQNRNTRIFAVLGSVLGLALSSQALAHDDYRDRDHHKHWKHHSHQHERFTRERVVVERPVYVERYVTYAPPPPPRNPGVVVSFDIPPLVFPLR